MPLAQNVSITKCMGLAHVRAFHKVANEKIAVSYHRKKVVLT